MFATFFSYFCDLLAFKSKQVIHRRQTPPLYRNAARGTRFTVVVRPSRFGVAPITAKRDVIHRPEVHNVAQRRQRRTEPRPQEICT